MAKHIAMSWFGTKELKKRVAALDKGQGEIAGQIIGVVYGVKAQTNEIKGQSVLSYKVFGDFQATRTSDGEVVDAQTSYLPNYFAEQLQALLERNGGNSAQFASNVKLVSTDKEIPVAWEMESILGRDSHSPIEAMKERILSRNKGALLLPPPEDDFEASPKALSDMSKAVDADEIPDPVEPDAPADADPVDPANVKPKATRAKA